MRIGVYGGSFDPPHVGHLMVSSWLRWTDRVDEVWWVPVASHPFGKAVAPLAIRRSWCEEAVVDLPWVRIDPIESELPPPSFTLHTLDALAARHPGHTFRLVVGADVLGETHRWKAWDEITVRYAPIIVGRAGYASPPDAVAFPPISSTDIRRRAAAGAPIDALVPAAIVDAVRAWYAAPTSGPEPAG